MSSMVHTLLPKTRRFALTAAVLALAASAGTLTAQSWGQGADSGNLVARQPGAMGTALARWETLQASREMRFVDYAGFVLAYPDFPRSDILRLRAEKALESDAPSQAEVLSYFDAQPPLTNPARARYALALAAAQRPEAFEEARLAWRGAPPCSPSTGARCRWCSARRRRSTPCTSVRSSAGSTTLGRAWRARQVRLRLREPVPQQRQQGRGRPACAWPTTDRCRRW